MATRSGIVTLTSDLGLRDAYVASIKGVIWGANFRGRVVDISHDIPPQDIMQAAFVLGEAARFFPEGTVHLVAVDTGHPGAAVAMRHRGQLYVGPDNGLLALVAGGQPEEAVRLDVAARWNSTEHRSLSCGRDIFAPVAAKLAKGATLSDVGSPIDTISSLHWATPIHDDHGIRGWIAHVDHFGNCITNVTEAEFEQGRNQRRFKCYAGTVILDTVSREYAAVPAGDPVLIFNSNRLVELAVSRGSASELFGISTGSPINLVFLDG